MSHKASSNMLDGVMLSLLLARLINHQDVVFDE